jgi:hypothetical protein
MSDSNNTLIIKETMENKPTKVSSEQASVDVNKYVNEATSSTEDVSSNTVNGFPSSLEIIPEPLKLEFNRENIEAQGNHIHLVDTDEDSNVDMFCYVKCDENDNELIKQCRGVVFSGKDLVMKAFPYTSELNSSQIDKIDDSIGDFNDWSFYNSHEGACVRMFNHSGKWFLSTHRKLNAFRSKWASSESFGTSFKNALTAEEENNPVFKTGLPIGDNILERFQSTLDISKQYMFLIRNTKDNRIVCSAPERATVYHVGTFVDGELVMTENVNLPVPSKISFENIDELREYVDKVSYRDFQGVIGFTASNKQLKIINTDYQDLFNARGNEPSIKFRYLQVRMDRRFVNMLYHLYPNMAESFDEYENTLFEIGRGIYRAYVQRFIKKKYVTVPREEFAVIRECHSWHIADRENNRVSIDQIMRLLNQQSPTHLNHMIRRFKLEQNNQKNQTDITRPHQPEYVHRNKSFEKSPIVRKINPNNIPSVTPLSLYLENNGQKDNYKYKNNSRTSAILPRKPLYVPKRKENIEDEAVDTQND